MKRILEFFKGLFSDWGLDKVGNTYTKTESDDLFATKTEVNEAIANAITTTLNTEV